MHILQVSWPNADWPNATFVYILTEKSSQLGSQVFLNNLTNVKADSHYCVFRVRLRQTVAFLQGDRKFPISALTQPTAENADRCI